MIFLYFLTVTGIPNRLPTTKTIHSINPGYFVRPTRPDDGGHAWPTRATWPTVPRRL
ncbi:MAG: hypothetical protein E7L40_01205 [Corynebacterium kroppenstedtii]|uniref:hypothetical protein n=1 Tax=Corynebacterium kroppenstedtii TaxID=161879 RepID=UPI0026F2E998|nr:hypothetical protein [Corynebacterium kroppenstedtii]MDU7286238.1 hypothetical protein [Corynebacterium kroppenstedtii]